MRAPAVVPNSQTRGDVDEGIRARGTWEAMLGLDHDIVYPSLTARDDNRT